MKLYGRPRTAFPELLGLKVSQRRCVSQSVPHNLDQIPAHKKRFVPSIGTYPQGFLVGSIYSGIKSIDKSQPDLVVVASDRPSYGAGVFTKNEFAAPSVVFSRSLVRRANGSLRGVIVNSGCANLFNGEAGIADTARMSQEIEKCISSSSNENAQSGQRPSMMVMHTGSGGQRLPIENIVDSIPKLYQSRGSSHDHWLEAARGMMTSDSFPKLVSRTFTLPSSPKIVYSIAGLTKGAGMIHPNMATTLGIICTDACVHSTALQRFLSSAADRTYNCISIEGDTSTNDMVVMFANGAAGGPEIPHQTEHASGSGATILHSARDTIDDSIAFQQILASFMAEMAQLVVRDAEGAKKFITIRVRNSPSHPAAKHIASVIARSILMKTESSGKGPDWGTIAIALGYSLVDTQFAGKDIVKLESTSISLIHGDIEIKFLNRGVPTRVSSQEAEHVMGQEDVELLIDLRDDGTLRDTQEAVYWTCDLTHDFITMNSEQ